MTKTSLVKGTAVLAAAGLFVKFLGAFFRIPLANMIGAAGMASYAPAYSLYNFLLVFSTAGIPVAVSKMVSERQADGRYREAAQVFHLSRMLMFMTGITGFGIVFLYAEEIAGLFHVPGASLSMRAMAPALFLVPLVASYRGYFQGMNNMIPTAVSQITELLEQMDEKYKSVIKMHLILQFSLKEIADMKGMEYSTVRSLYSRGIRKLRNSCLSLEEGGSDE